MELACQVGGAGHINKIYAQKRSFSNGNKELESMKDEVLRFELDSEIAVTLGRAILEVDFALMYKS